MLTGFENPVAQSSIESKEKKMKIDIVGEVRSKKRAIFCAALFIIWLIATFGGMYGASHIEKTQPRTTITKSPTLIGLSFILCSLD